MLLLIPALFYYFTLGEPCFIYCDTTVTISDSDNPEARTTLEAGIGQPLPAWAQVDGVEAGGFTDQFIHARLTIPADQRDAMLAFFEMTNDNLREEAPNPFPDPLPWWNIAEYDRVETGSGRLRAFDYVFISIAPVSEDPQSLHIYINAFEV